jgi:hypothetical protein
MILTDGTTTLTFSVSGNNSPDNDIETATGQASGGSLRQSVAGERFQVEELTLVDGDECRSLLNLLNSSFTQLYYTPDDIPVEMSTSDFPYPVSVKYKGKETVWYNGEVQYIVKLMITGTDYQ